MRVFVYGTLKENYGNNVFLRGQSLVGPGVIENYKLMEYSRGSIPYAVPFEGSRIRGEVWDIGDDKRCLHGMDSLEGHPFGYLRVTETTVDGQEVEIYTKPRDRVSLDRLLDVPLNADGEHEWTR